MMESSSTALAQRSVLRYLLLGTVSAGVIAALLVLLKGIADDLEARHRQLIHEAVAEALDKTLAEQRKIAGGALAEERHSLAAQHQILAGRQSAAFIDEHLLQVKAYPDRFALLSASLKAIPPELADKLYCEFGVYTGRTINFMAEKLPNRIFHGFDSFEGLPEDWRPGFEAGTFSLDGLPKVRDNVRLHKGWFDKSLPVWLQQHPGPLAFAHLDADLYSSTKTVLTLCADRIVPGTILQFDEFFNYPGWKEGEYKAFMEFVQEHEVRFEYLGYTNGTHGEQVAVRIQSIKPRAAPKQPTPPNGQ